MSERRAGPRLRVVLLLCAGLWLMAFKKHSDDEIIRNFDIVVFNSEFKEITDKRVRKWVAPLRIYLDIRIPNDALFRDMTEAMAVQLARVSRHEVSLVRDKSAANVIGTFARAAVLQEAAEEYFPGDADLPKIIRTNLCVGRYYSNQAGEIIRAHVFIPSDRAISRGKLPHCIAEEFTQVMGLPNDSDQVHVSLFNDKSVLDRLTPHDATLVRLLYDRRIKPGMPRDQALRVARRILPELRP